jgi:hypothetical protein
VSQKSEIEMARLAVTKVTRIEIRLKHALMADQELNEVLPQRLAEFDLAVQNGTLPGLALKLVSGDDDSAR